MQIILHSDKTISSSLLAQSLQTYLAGNQWYSLKYAKGWNIDSRLITSQKLETLGFNGAHDMPGNSEVSSWMVIIKGPTQLHYCRAQ